MVFSSSSFLAAAAACCCCLTLLAAILPAADSAEVLQTKVIPVKGCKAIVYTNTKYMPAPSSGERFEYMLKKLPGADSVEQCVGRCLKFGQGCKAVNFKKPQCEYLKYGIEEPDNVPKATGWEAGWSHAYVHCDAAEEDKARNLDDDVKNDLEKVIAQFRKSDPICNLVYAAEKALQRNYDWVQWWVALAKKPIKFTSARGHVVQAQVSDGSKQYTLVAAYSEKDTIVPPIEQLSWDPEKPPAFFENRLAAATFDGVGNENSTGDFYDNIVVINAKPSDYQCRLSAVPSFAFYKDKDTGNRKSGGGGVGAVKDGAFFFYYKSLSLTNTFACVASTQQLGELKSNFKRSRHCAGSTFANVVSSALARHAAGQKLIRADVRVELTGALYDYFTTTYPEFHWTVYVLDAAPLTLLHCEGSTNCARVHVGEHGVANDFPIVAVWSPKCYLAGIIENAKHFFLWSSKVQKKAFENETGDAVDALSDFLQDPVGYAASRGLPVDDERMLKEFKRAPKVLILNEVKDGSAPWNVNVQLSQQNGAQYQAVVKTRRDQKEHHIYVRVDFYANFDKPSWCQA